MQPSFDMQIRSMIKALSTVIPAIDQTNSTAVEQGHLVVASLELLNEQIDYAHWFEAAEAADLVRLLKLLKLLAGTENTASFAVDAIALSERTDIPLSMLRDSNRALCEEIATTLKQIFDTGVEAASRYARETVLEQAQRLITLERAYVGAVGTAPFLRALSHLKRHWPSDWAQERRLPIIICFSKILARLDASDIRVGCRCRAAHQTDPRRKLCHLLAKRCLSQVVAEASDWRLHCVLHGMGPML